MITLDKTINQFAKRRGQAFVKPISSIHM